MKKFWIKSWMIALLFGLIGIIAAMAQEPSQSGVDLFAFVNGKMLTAEEMGQIEGGRISYNPPRTTVPVNNGGKISSSTGSRDPISTSGGRTGKSHNGTDMPASPGTPVRSTKDGTVLSYGHSPKSGGYITIKNNDGSESRYLHIEPSVKIRDSVRKGQHIATVGKPFDQNSGGLMTTGSHLHYEERRADGSLVPTSEVKGYGRRYDRR